MPGESEIDYTGRIQSAMLAMIRDLLFDVSQEGLPGEHHFYLTFATGHPGVELSAQLRQSYPDEMTVVLQNQFWNLEVNESHLAVTLRFGGVPERLLVPWEALVGFADPHANFGLRLTTESETEPDSDETASTGPKGEDGVAAGNAAVISIDQFRRR